MLREEGPAALEWAASYLDRVGDLPVLAQVEPGAIRSALPTAAPEHGEPFSAVLRDLEEVLLPGVTHWQHPRFFGYFATSSSEPAILAELLAATLNSVAILWRTALDAGRAGRRARDDWTRPRGLLRAGPLLGREGGADARDAAAEGPL